MSKVGRTCGASLAIEISRFFSRSLLKNCGGKTCFPVFGSTLRPQWLFKRPPSHLWVKALAAGDLIKHRARIGAWTATRSEQLRSEEKWEDGSQTKREMRYKESIIWLWVKSDQTGSFLGMIVRLPNYVDFERLDVGIHVEGASAIL